jgi:hypothetical protein
MLGGAASAKTASYTLVAADAGSAISMSNASATTITVNTALFAAGDTVHITNLGAGVCTITAGTATVNSSASLALAQYESGFLDFTSTSAAIFVKGAGAAPAAGGMALISTTTLSGSSVALTSIPQTYKSLYLVIRNPRPAQDQVGFLATLNNDTGTKYRDVRAFTSNSMTANGTGMYLSGTNMDNGASEGLITMLINDYTNTVTRKIVQIVAVINNNTTLANLDFTLTYSIFFDNGAISRIDLFPEGVQGWTSGSVLLYGVS